MPKKPPFRAVTSPYRVPYEGEFRVAGAATRPPKGTPKSKELKRRLADLIDRFDDLQRMLFARDEHAVLLIFQAMDAAGKDGTIRAVLSGVNPASFQTFSFKQPTSEELDHDFLWRTARALPERGRIGVFNRSYYEEVLVVRVHPEYLEGQRLPRMNPKTIWKERFRSILDHEEHLARNGVVILKFWLNVSREEQKRRFLSRIDEPEKRWKFSKADVAERRHWDAYMEAYQEMLDATSRPWAPWYAIPADDKPSMRVAVADIIVRSLETLKLSYPEVDEARVEELLAMRKDLEED